MQPEVIAENALKNIAGDTLSNVGSELAGQLFFKGAARMLEGQATPSPSSGIDSPFHGGYAERIAPSMQTAPLDTLVEKPRFILEQEGSLQSQLNREAYRQMRARLGLPEAVADPASELVQLQNRLHLVYAYEKAKESLPTNSWTPAQLAEIKDVLWQIEDYQRRLWQQPLSGLFPEQMPETRPPASVAGYEQPKTPELVLEAVGSKKNPLPAKPIDALPDFPVYIQQVTPPGASSPVEVYTDGYAQVSVGKITKYIRGKVDVDIDVVNAQIAELNEIKKGLEGSAREMLKKQIEYQNALLHNYKRSHSMQALLEKVGIEDTAEENQRIANTLLEVAKNVTEKDSNIFSCFQGENGLVLIESRWKLLMGKTPYLTTIILREIKQQ